MKNTSLQVKDEERQRNIQLYMNKMQFSGYGKQEWIRVYNKAKKLFNEKVENSKIYPHKDKFMKMKELTQEKLHQKKTWYSNGKYKSIVYVDATTNSNLAKKCQQVLDKVLEKTGDSIRNLLVRSNLFKSKNRNDEKCTICLFHENNINCKTCDVIYENYCEHQATCKGYYIDETAGPIKERFRKHLDDYVQ